MFCLSERTCVSLRRFSVLKSRRRILSATIITITFLTIFAYASLPRQHVYRMLHARSIGLDKEIALFNNKTISISEQSTDFSQASWFRNRRSYSYKFDERLSPTGSFHGLKLLVVATSALQNFAHRTYIRETWGTKLRQHSDSKLVFLLGSTSNSALQGSVEMESALHGDLLQFSFTDSYENLTTKSTVMLGWSQRWKPTYLVKVDDDVMVNFEGLVDVLETINNTSVKHFIAGLGFFGAQPIRWWFSKFYVSRDEYAYDSFPDYVSGMIYIITGNLIEKLYDEALRTEPSRFEDLFMTGYLPTRLAVPRLSLPGIDLREKYSDCDMHELLAIQLSDVGRMAKLHEILEKTVRVCQPWFFWNRCKCLSHYGRIIS